MSKNFPCKSCIKNTNGGCCNILPIFNEGELAKVLYEHNQLIKDKNLFVRRYNNLKSVYIITPELTQKQITKGIDIADFTCPFLDIEKGCLIYENRPFICKQFGESYGKCPYEGLEQVPENSDIKYEVTHDKKKEIDLVFSNYFAIPSNNVKELNKKKALKIANSKEFQHLMVAYNEIATILKNTNYLKKTEKYAFVETANKIFNPFKITLIKEHYPFIALQKGFNFLQRKIMIIKYDYLQPVETKINNIINEMPDMDFSYDKPEYKLLFTTLYLECFKDNFKNKKGEYGGLINSNELYALKKELFFRLGFTSYIQAANDKNISNISKYVEELYKRITQSK